MVSKRKLITSKKAQHQLRELMYNLKTSYSEDYAAEFIKTFHTTKDLIFYNLL